MVSPQVPIEEIISADEQTEIIRSVPLPPPIIPETEESTPSPVSEASSGYMSTSLSTVTLSDVYTLSWDLPPSSGFEAVPDEEEEDNKVTQSDTYPKSFLVEPQESWQVLNSKTSDERTDSPPSKLDKTSSDSNFSQQELNHSSVAQLKERDPVAESNVPVPNEQKQVSKTDHVRSEQLDNLDPLKELTLVQEEEFKQTESPPADHSKPEAHLTGLVPAAIDETEPQLSLHTEALTAEGPSQLESSVPQPQQPKKVQSTFEIAQDSGSKVESASSSALSGEPVLVPSKEQSTSEAPDPHSTSTPALASASATAIAPSEASTKAAATPEVPLSSVQPSKAAALAANPFKIQKVKSSDLKSFQRILGEGEGKPGQVDQANSIETGLHLSVPMESLEIISDSEEGDSAATTVPDWLKEGEFVTVGTNKCGTVRYVGPTDFAEGIWVGVELEVPAGEQNISDSSHLFLHFCLPHW